MSTLIFRTTAPIISALMLIFSVFILLRGHNEPGGGFIGGLIAAAAIALYAMAFGVGETRRRLRINPIVVSGLGVMIAAASGLIAAFAAAPYLTAIWLPNHLFGVPGLFDIGVYLTVGGMVSAVALALEDGGQGH